MTALQFRLACAAAVLLIAIAPGVLSPFSITLMNYIGVYALAVLGLVLLAGIAICNITFAVLMPPLAGGVLLLLALYLCFGLGNGATFQLVPHRWAGKTGLMTGIIGAAGGIGGFYLPVIMGMARESKPIAVFVFIVTSLRNGKAFCSPRIQLSNPIVPTPKTNADAARMHHRIRGLGTICRVIPFTPDSHG